jgi:hypothetical protein
MVRVLVCDDEGARASGLRLRLRRRFSGLEDFEVSSLSVQEFMNAIIHLEDRQRRARANSGKTAGKLLEDDGQHPFDNTDVLLVDYDLVRLGSAGNRSSTQAESGERVCYLARCYSRCGTIVAYNQFSYQAAFDLTLRGHIRSFADLNVSTDSAASAGLWTDSYTGFRPWSWPTLATAHERLNRRADTIVNHLNDPILSTLGLADDGIYDLFTREQLELLSPMTDPRLATFEDFVRNSSIGLRPRDQLFGPQSTARVAAARIGKWLERSVLPDQNILVDAPHLISRFPSLIGEPNTEDHWNGACRLMAALSDLGVDLEKLTPHQFGAVDWLSRPAWLWPGISTDKSITEVRDPWSPRPDNLVFCEDVSRFRPRRTATEFVADVAPEFARRYIQRLKQVNYVPLVRMLM